MQPTQDLVDQLYRERVERARHMPLEEKFLAGARLFDQACRLMADGIRNQFPDADEVQVQEIMAQRLRLLRSLRRRHDE
jgi:hypothetical protein